MLVNIKSKYIISIIFTFIKEKRKLEIVKYNKNIQNKINIALLNYKLFKGKYLIYGTKTRVKEYDSYDDELIFEGEYLNGVRNGKGKEYYKYYGKTEFEGEYLNGKRNG